LRNEHLDKWYGREVELLRHLDTESANYALARKEGNFDIAAVIAGESAGLVHETLPAGDVIERTVGDAAKLLKFGAPQVQIVEA
jgi:nitronate monooxygenase